MSDIAKTSCSSGDCMHESEDCMHQQLLPHLRLIRLVSHYFVINRLFIRSCFKKKSYYSQRSPIHIMYACISNPNKNIMCDF